MSTAIVWFRRDLRLADNPALNAAVAKADRVVPVFIHAPDEEAPWQPGAASNWWLHHSLKALDRELQQLGAPLVVRSGESIAQLEQLIAETGAETVCWNRLYEPAIIERDQNVREALAAEDVGTFDFNAALLTEPDSIRSQSGAPYKVFTPFWRSVLAGLDHTAPGPAPSGLSGVTGPESLDVNELGLLPAIRWDEAFDDHWTPGEHGAHAQLEQFVENTIGDYADARNRPDLHGTSRLSPHLHFGEVSPRQVVWAARAATERHAAFDLGAEKFLAEIGWREFAHHLLVHFPFTIERPLRDNFNEFPWREIDEPLARHNADRDFVAWREGNSGIPLVDAGMRELWHTGWMHNRVRMVVASFLTKNQLISWQAGARWFWDTLVDADLASNTLGWQWTAGCGADAAPFFRIFNPVRQGEKFDPKEIYVRHWCPELADIPRGSGHAPWTASADAKEPVVDLAASRRFALEAFQQIKKSA